MSKCMKIALVLSGAAVVSAMHGAEITPRSYYGTICKRVAEALPKNHVLKMPLNAEMSQRAWTNLVTYYDFDHSIFLQSDLDRLSDRQRTIGKELRDGDPTFGFDLYRLYVTRLNERMDFATNMLAHGDWDFSTNETYRIRRKDAPWPATRSEAEDHWRRRIKNEVLVQILNAELDKSTNRIDAAGDILKRYRQYAMTLTESDDEQVLQHYLSAVARAYDPHSDYMSPEVREDFDMEMNLTLCGVGAVLTMEDGAPKIVEIMPGGPIDRDGRIRVGDRIFGVKQGDGEMEDIVWQPLKKSIKKIRGPKDSRVTLEIHPKADPSAKKLIELVRDAIKLEEKAATGHVERVTIGAKELKLGYIDLPSFYGTMDKRPGTPGFRSCALDVNRYLCDFNAGDVAGLVLDLRSNGGGSLREAALLSALFAPGDFQSVNLSMETGRLEMGTPIVQVSNGRGDPACLIVRPGLPVCFRKPMVILTDRASASASEIVAGFLQDADRALILGDSRTHGKGTVQTVMGLGPDKFGSVKITTARFYCINGRSTQVEGVNADIHLPSLFDTLDIGEDKLPNALPFSRILPARFNRCWNAHDHLKEIAALSAERLKGNVAYVKHLKNVSGMKALSERETVPLEREARKRMMAADRELRELDDPDDDEAEEKAAKKRRNQRRKDDVVLDEAYNILADLIRLSGNEEVRQPDEWSL